jgi:hypothetical protein
MTMQHRNELDAKIKSLRAAADQLDEVRSRANQPADAAVVDTQSCCNTCTLISFVPPCKNACISVSPLF